jgi:hypothetical protein
MYQQMVFEKLKIQWMLFKEDSSDRAKKSQESLSRKLEKIDETEVEKEETEIEE